MMAAGEEAVAVAGVFGGDSGYLESGVFRF